MLGLALAVDLVPQAVLAPAGPATPRLLEDGTPRILEDTTPRTLES